MLDTENALRIVSAARLRENPTHVSSVPAIDAQMYSSLAGKVTPNSLTRRMPCNKLPPQMRQAALLQMPNWQVRPGCFLPSEIHSLLVRRPIQEDQWLTLIFGR